MRLLLRCGCDIEFRENSPVICATHGDVGVARTIGAKPPRIRGVASGPHVERCDLSAHVDLLPGVSPLASPKETRH